MIRTNEASLVYEVVTEGLRFPEGPIAMSDGSVVLVEIARGTLTRVTPDGQKSLVADCGGGPNGAAVGPDGAIYVANNGGCFDWIDLGSVLVPGGVPDSWWGHGSIQRVDVDSGEVTTLYTECDGHPLRAPNDLVFDAAGGFWFTDHGVRLERSSDRTGVYYATVDGSSITEVLFPLDAPNGVGLSPLGDHVYVAETHTGRLWEWSVPAPGTATMGPLPLNAGGTLLYGAPGMRLFDSLAVDGDGYVCVATLGEGGISAVAPDGSEVEFWAIDDPVVTNICFGGDDLRTAWITSSATGRLLRTTWPRPGLELPFNR